MLPPEKRAKIIAALKANPNARAVAKQVGGVNHVTVWKIAKQTGIALAVENPGLAPRTRAKIIAALKANPNASAVAKQVGGVSLRTVWRIAKQTGIALAAENPTTGKRHSPKTRAKIIAALKANPNASAVAKQVGGTSYSTVWRIAKQTGIALAAENPATGKRLSQKTRTKIIAALKANPNAKAVAKQVGGASHVTVWKIAKQMGVRERL